MPKKVQMTLKKKKSDNSSEEADSETQIKWEWGFAPSEGANSQKAPKQEDPEISVDTPNILVPTFEKKQNTNQIVISFPLPLFYYKMPKYNSPFTFLKSK